MLVPELKKQLSRLLWWQSPRSSHSDLPKFPEEPPLRAELFSVDHLERHARVLAAEHVLLEKRTTDKLLPRLAENERVLIDTYDLITKAAENNRRIAPAAEWLLDNFYLIEEQIRSTRRLLPKSYSGELPRLAQGASAEYPRVYAIALELISHTDGRVDAAGLEGFIASYQTVVPLKLGELWALPLMLRLALIENLRRVAARITQGRGDRDLATDWAERLIQVVENRPTDLILVLADMARADPTLSGAFLAEFTRHLQGLNPNFAFVTSWLEHRLADQGQTTEQLVLAEGQAQAADQVSVGNSITSLRFLSVHDWPEFVSTHSLVEQTLNDDPAGVYAKMDFATRDRYRHAVEGIAKRSLVSEYEVAHRAVQLSHTAAENRAHQRTTHVGYYLVDRGRPALERLMEMRLTTAVILEKIRRTFPLFVYLWLVFLIAGSTFTLFLTSMDWQAERTFVWVLIAVPLFLCAAQLGIAIANWLTSVFISPQPLPRLDFRSGIPPEHRTLVAIPTMLTSAKGVDHLLEGLEIRYLSNRDPCLHFALLTDLTDATKESLPQDADFVRLASEGIERLNAKYATERSSTFYLLHRNRRFNPSEQVWMGYERKRGKLADLNATLRGATGRFSCVIGNLAAIADVRYVITLDTDTQLPRDAARGMVGAMAHTLNRPVLDSTGRRVVDGYNILQPRVGVSLPSSQRSWFARLFGGDAGVDPYTRVVSDLYQDLFHEGSFIGKGIYDVDSFEQRCGNFPENAILSHDLLESCYGRSALLSDVILYEDFPCSYAADAGRRHRWMRGDWQIAAWLLPRVSSLTAHSEANPISALAWWKIFDNLRRSILPVAMLAVLVIVWLSGSWELSAAATLFMVAIVGVPLLLQVMVQLTHKPTDLSLSTHLGTVFVSLGRPLAQCLFTLVFIPYDAYLSCDAILRTLIRVHWTKRKLLEWKTSSDTESSARGDVGEFYGSMLSAPLLSISVCLWLIVQHSSSLFVALPLLLTWSFSPLIAWWLSRPLITAAVQLTRQQQLFLRKLTRKTWRYFEVFVTKSQNWLPPDNVQTNAGELIASRTSPTNIGMALLADLAAYDFGYCSVARLMDRIQRTFGTLHNLERFRGHFFNWYDTQTLKPLLPHYVSTVDSGNLAGHLLVLASGLRLLPQAEIMPRQTFRGLHDTLSVLLDIAQNHQPLPGGGAPLQLDGNLIRSIEGRLEKLETQTHTLSAVANVLPKLLSEAADLRNAFAGHEELCGWASAYEGQIMDLQSELQKVAAWVFLTPPPECLRENAHPENQLQLNALHSCLEKINDVPTLQHVAALSTALGPLLEGLRSEQQAEGAAWLLSFQQAVIASSDQAVKRIQCLEQLAKECDCFTEMDYSFLHQKSRDLFAIGFNVSDNRLDSGCYDLLASEARLVSFVLVAQGQLGQEHWFALGRLLTNTGGAPALLSWSGSMFEYLMPLLVMPTYEHTLLDQTYRAVVRRQIAYGRQRGVPWGISESGYNTVDLLANYQYRAFGVPGLGLKRGLAEDLVIAPYATVMALMVEPVAAYQNLLRLTSEDRLGAYGFYEAVDYTPSRLPPGVSSISVKQFMAHHAGMSVLSLAYVLLDKPMQQRFTADPMLRAAELLLQECIPKTTVPIFPHAIESSATRSVTAEEAGTMRILTDPNSAVPEVHLLSNGQYHVAITSAGGGYSRWRDLAVTRWREDTTRDNWGSFCYLRDVESGALWSNTWHPTGSLSKSYEAIFTLSRAEFRRRDEQIEAYTQISVSAEDDLELRRITLSNRSDRPRTIEITSYNEVVMATQAQDESHPAFSNLFVQSEIIQPRHAIFCTRRPRSAEERPPWLMHMMTTSGTVVDEPSFETDRMQFIGRGKSLAWPQACHESQLSNTSGSTLDPIVSIRTVLLLQPHETVYVDIFTGITETRAALLGLAEKYSDPSLANRVFELAWSRGPIMLQQLNATEAEAQTYGRLAGSVIYASELRRDKASVMLHNHRGQSGLWGYGISGDYPIALIRIRDHEKIELVLQAVQAHAYWRMKGLTVDLVIWNEDDSIYRQSLQEAIMDVVAASREATLLDRPGGIFVRRGEQMSEEDRTLFQTVARVVLPDTAGTFLEQVERRARVDVAIPLLRPTKRRAESVPPIQLPERDLAFFNGLGGFSRDGREYVVILHPHSATPAPWVNVIANAHLGTVISESGSAYTWAENSHEFRLTPWKNDPVSDAGGEAIYLRDEESGRFWSLTPLPARGANTYITRHGFGYSIFDYSEDGITTELCIYVDIDAAVKFARIKISNRSGRARQLSLTGYWEWVLGENRGKTLLHVVTEVDPATGAVFAKNSYSADFANMVAFVDCSEVARNFTGDRTEFLGRNGSPAHPAAMKRTRLSNRTGARFDPCTALQTPFTLEEHQEKIIVFTIGAASDEDQARQLVQRFRGEGNAQRALEGVWHYWSETLGAVHVETPDMALNFLANGWLIYQTLACRMWARTGFYQSGGAYGFRDQLQDAMALIHAAPGMLRQHLLRASSRQFREGDVQHWWHPPVGRGVRTHFSDDYLWLPLAICRYVNTTGDTGLLEEQVPFLSSRPLHIEEEANYDLPLVSEDIGSVYEHAVRAIDHALQFGTHGLPLMGCGDWNDGMNLVGQHGQGESVWLAFFLYAVLTQFSELSRARGDTIRADRYQLEAGRLRGNIELHGWDGQWYRRAYFDDGTPLGSEENAECQIDSLSQSWSILSGAGTLERSTQAMESVNVRLVRRESKLIQLFDPPFDHSELNPGYIKGYVPGVRENGGQYTHGAIWAVMAYAEMGDAERAWELFSLINPVLHGATAAAIAKYRVEPYVVAADVYGVVPHVGRGGWTWYTGSAGWMYRLVTESLLGLQLDVDKLRFTARPHRDWSSYKIHYRHHGTFYHITIHGGGSGTTIQRFLIDGMEQDDHFVRLVDDHVNHEVVIQY